MDWETQYTLYSEKIYTFLYFLTFDEGVAEDLMQETFVKAHIAAATFRGEANELTWLRKIARNLAFDYQKRQRIIRFIPFVTGSHEEKVTLTPEQLVHLQEDVRALYTALAQLKFEYRAAIVLRKIEQLSIKEAAHILGWNEAKVRNNTERGLKALKAEMEGAQCQWNSSLTD